MAEHLDSMASMPIGEQLRMGIIPEGFSAVHGEGAEVLEGPVQVPHESLPVIVEYGGSPIGRIAIVDRFNPSKLRNTSGITFERH